MAALKVLAQKGLGPPPPSFGTRDSPAIMMYRTHAGTGVLFGLLVDLGLAAAGYSLPVEQAVLVPVVAGLASALPDVDHHSAKIRFALPPARWLYVLVYWVLASYIGDRHARYWMGHRRITPVYWVLAFYIGDRHARYWMGHRRITHSISFAVAMGAFVAVPVVALGGWWWIGPVIGLGCLAHVAGDYLTTSGCPLWLPWSGKNYTLGLCRTNGFSEQVFAALQSFACAGLVGWGLL